MLVFASMIPDNASFNTPPNHSTNKLLDVRTTCMQIHMELSFKTNHFSPSVKQHKSCLPAQPSDFSLVVSATCEFLSE